jgi:sulfur-carrier protein adenylyltransferase/sulfurtransferase
MTETLLLDLITAGLSASSADNSQPWQLTVVGDRIELGLNQSRLGMFFDPGLAASLLSCGGVCELMRIAATGYGLTAEITLLPNDEHPQRVAQLSFHDSSADPDPLLNGIHTRGTHRGHYRRWRRVAPDALDFAANAAMQIPGHRVVWLSGKARRATTHLIYMADTVRFSHREAHEQFYEKLCFGADAARWNDGLASDTLGIERVFLPVLQLLAPWSVTSKLNRVGWNYLMALRGAWVPCLTAAGLGAIIQERETGYVQGGRALHRLWIAMNQSGLAFQPLGALSLFLMRLDDLQGAGFKESQLNRLREIQRALPMVLADFEPVRERLILLFRYGYPIRPAPNSRRRPVEDFIRRDSSPPEFYASN